MKTIIASAALLLCATASTRNLKITVSDLRSDKGRILWYIHGDARPRQGMEKPKSGSVAFSAEDFTADSVTLYLFHDENGNYRLDRRDDGKPAEGCCTRAIVLSAEKNEIRVRLRYEFPEEPAGEAAETPARAKIPAARRRPERMPERPTNWTADRNKFIPLQRKDTRTWKRRDSMRPKAWR